MTAHRRTLALIAAVALLGGCARAPAYFRPAPLNEWRATLHDARMAADSGKWATADRLLGQYELRYPGTEQARETFYWRGLFRMAPSNDSTAHRAAVPTLERYLAEPGGTYRTEARMLLDVARANVALREEAAAKEREIAQIRLALGRAQSAPAATTSPGSESSSSDRGLAGEVERLRRDLAQANAELERIRKRLAGERPR